MNFVNADQQPTENKLSRGLRAPDAADKAPGYLENIEFLIVDNNAFMRSIVKTIWIRSMPIISVKLLTVRKREKF